MFDRVIYTVRWGYLVENHRENWQAMELALSEKLSGPRRLSPSGSGW